ncbi:MAG: YerC/YecD family TrpR-related protein [bacterium]|nr:YerC/YecD family TrpR-related protein [bacterium]
MAKFTPYQNLSKEVKQKVLLELCQAMVIVKKLPDAAKVLSDLLSEQELQMIAKRLQIAKLLLKKKTYLEIRKELRVSQHTIARVNIWLQQGGAGFRMVVEQGKDMTIPAWKPWSGAGSMSGSWEKVKRSFPMYFWPQLLLEDIVRSANNKQREKLLNTLKVLRTAGKEKKEAFRFLEDILNEERRSPRQKQDHSREMHRGIK